MAGIREEMLGRMRALSDASYKAFNDRILNAPSVPTLGIRVPELRKLAREAAAEEGENWLDEMILSKGAFTFQEEHMVFGMAAGYRKCSKEKHAELLDVWVPGIISWADCDCGTSTLQWMKKDQEFWFSYLMKWLKSGREFEVRFGVIALMDYFLNDWYIDEVLRIYTEIEMDDYYVRMGIAWAIATAYVKYPQKIIEILKKEKLDVWTHNKAIQKCRESRRVSAEDKETLSILKRRQEEKNGK